MVVREGSAMQMFRGWASSVGSTLSGLSIIPKCVRGNFLIGSYWSRSRSGMGNILLSNNRRSPRGSMGKIVPEVIRTCHLGQHIILRQVNC